MINDKITQDLVQEMAARSVHEEIPIIVKYRKEVYTTRAFTPGVGAIRSYKLIPAVSARATAQTIETLSQDPAVERIWQDLPVYTCLADSVPLIGAPQVWEAGYTGKGVTLAVVDTGLDHDHPDFAGRIAETTDFTGEGPADNHGHGTHVASIAAGSGEASGGKYRGVAPEAAIYAAKVLRGDGSGMMSDVMAGVEWAVEKKVRVINLSLGGPAACDGRDALSETCDAAVKAGAVVCVAAGNAGPGRSTIGSPGCARLVITMGATDDEDNVADFSSRGPTSDGRVKPDIVFPGVGIIAGRARGTSMGTPLDQYYTQASGTSMATPHCSGAVALLLQANPDLTPAEVKDILMRTAKDLALDPNTQGTGRADVYKAYLEVGVPVPV
ncbi:MAG: S8 family peptidase, partial [Anaerolineae bacterium]